MWAGCQALRCPQGQDAWLALMTKLEAVDQMCVSMQAAVVVVISSYLQVTMAGWS